MKNTYAVEHSKYWHLSTNSVVYSINRKRLLRLFLFCCCDDYGNNHEGYCHECEETANEGR